MTTLWEVIDLIERFTRNHGTYRSREYNEAQVRLELINPFFKTLGWDMYNEAGYAEAYKDVVHEDTIKIGRAAKAPDHAFRIGFSDPAAADSLYYATIAVRSCFYQEVTDYPSPIICGFGREKGGEV